MVAAPARWVHLWFKYCVPPLEENHRYNSMSGIPPGRKARRLLRRQRFGILSTHSVEVEGYPFGSVTPYMVGADGQPVILISTLAQHTRNIRDNPKVSLTILDFRSEDPLKGGRLTWVSEAEAIPSSDEIVKQRYVSYFPDAKNYFKTHGFVFYRLRLHRARFIGGFGDILWLDSDEVRMSNPLEEAEERILDHMNQDHADSLADCCRKLKGMDVKSVRMVGIDADGFDARADGTLVRFEFDTPATTAEAAREVLVKMARETAVPG